MSALDTSEQVHNPHFKGLGNQVQAGQSDIHTAILERPYLSPVKTCEVRELILRPTPLLAQGLNTRPQPLLDLLPLH